MQPSLCCVHILRHPNSKPAGELAQGIVKRLTSLPATRALRVPVQDHARALPPKLVIDDPESRHKPSHLDPDASFYSVIILCCDSSLCGDHDANTGDAWEAFVEELLANVDLKRHILLPVAIDPRGYSLSETLAGRNFTTVGDEQTLLSQVLFDLGNCLLHRFRHHLRIAEAEIAARVPRSKAKIKVFLSHAKRDLRENKQDTVHELLANVAARKVEHWFDAREIGIGEAFEDEIKDGICDADLMLILLTDSWSRSPWCRMEAAYAKERGLPLLVVDALEAGEFRSFPYGGNARVLQWPVPPEEAVMNILEDATAQTAAKEALRALRRNAAENVINECVLEAFRQVYTRATLQRSALQDGATEIILPVSPEAVHLAHHEDGTTFLYPDPPVTSEELLLLKKLRPASQFVTPLMRVAQQIPVPEGREAPLVVASLGNSPDTADYNYHDSQMHAMIDELYLYLIAAGMRIAYGGQLNAADIGKPENFTERLFELVSGYGEVLKQIGVRTQPIANYPPWPLDRKYDDDVMRLFGRRIAKLYRPDRPDVGYSNEQLGADGTGFFPPKSPEQRFAWGCGISEMRRQLTEHGDVRVAMGGKVSEYSGRYMGLIEESLCSLEAAKPLYLLGAYGGAARLVIDLLEQRGRPEMTTEAARENDAHYDRLEELHAEHRIEFLPREALAEKIRGYGANGPSAALKNGLNDAENRELFYTDEPQRAFELIATGMTRLLSE